MQTEAAAFDAHEAHEARSDFLVRVLTRRESRDERVRTLAGLEKLLRERFPELFTGEHESREFSEGVREVFGAAQRGDTPGAHVVACALILCAIVLEPSFHAYLAPPIMLVDGDEDVAPPAARVHRDTLAAFETRVLAARFDDLLNGADMPLSRFVADCACAYHAFLPTGAPAPVGDASRTQTGSRKRTSR